MPRLDNKIIIADTDPMGGAGVGDPTWVWRSFFRGLNLLYMDNYVGPDSVGLRPTMEAVEMRAAIGLTRLLAQHVEIGKFVPDRDLASTGYALRSPHALMVYVPDASQFTVDLRSDEQEYLTEWLSLQTGAVTVGPTVHGGELVELAAPDPNGSILYCRSAADSLQPMEAIQERAGGIWESAIRLSSWTIRMKFAALPALRTLVQSKTRVALALCISVFAGIAIGIFGTLLVLRREDAR
jgi:hypothetical protein